MILESIPWLELSLALPLVGAILVSRVRDQYAASRWCLGFTALTLLSTIVAWARVESGLAPDGSTAADILPRLSGSPMLALDLISAPLFSLVALLYFLTALATARTKMTRFSFTWLLVGESLRLSLFAWASPVGIAILLAINTIPPLVELVRHERPTRLYLIHTSLFIVLLFAGLAVNAMESPIQGLGPVLLLLAILVQSGTIPAHVWVIDLFENCTFGTALLHMVPLAGMYAAVRLVLPTAPDWVLTGIGAASLGTAVYAAGMAAVQRDVRRFFAYLFLSHASLALVGLQLRTVISLTGALCLWASVVISLGGLGLTLRALESRFGRLNLNQFQGLIGHTPSLAVCFLLTGLASVGFPGTLGFVAAEVLVDGAIGVNLFVGLAVIVAAAINGIAILRAYFFLFTGARTAPVVALGITSRERFAVLALATLILGGGLFPQLGVESRHRAAEAVLSDRDGHTTGE